MGVLSKVYAEPAASTGTYCSTTFFSIECRRVTIKKAWQTKRVSTENQGYLRIFLHFNAFLSRKTDLDALQNEERMNLLHCGIAEERTGRRTYTQYTVSVP